MRKSIETPEDALADWLANALKEVRTQNICYEHDLEKLNKQLPILCLLKQQSKLEEDTPGEISLALPYEGYPRFMQAVLNQTEYPISDNQGSNLPFLAVSAKAATSQDALAKLKSVVKELETQINFANQKIQQYNTELPEKLRNAFRLLQEERVKQYNEESAKKAREEEMLKKLWD